MKAALPFWIPAILCMAMLVMTDLILYALVSVKAVDGLSPAVWGTYAAWASAILPAFSLYASIGMWVADRRVKEAQDAWLEVNKVEVQERPGGGVWVTNRTSETIRTVKVETIDGEKTLGTYVAPTKDQMIEAVSRFRSLSVLVEGVIYRYTLEAPPAMAQGIGNVSR